jgi:hypothetical protein
MLKIAATLGATALLYVFRDPIEKLCTYVGTKISDIVFRKITVDLDKNPKTADALHREFSRHNIQNNNNIVAFDGPEDPDFRINNGIHIITTEYGKMIISVDDKIISLLAPKNTISLEDFRKYFTKIYKKHSSPDSLLMFFTSNKDGWKPLYRRPRKHNEDNFTSKMNDVIENVDIFVKNEDDYNKKGLPYQTGYLLHGKTGTGKSTLVEIIATKYNRSVYLLSLNSTGMTDEVLISLIASIPPYSILCIDEIDKQLESIKKNPDVQISMAGILTAMSGPQRLNHANIIIMTASNKDFVEQKYQDEFFRKGRTDNVFHLTDPYI